MNPSNSMADPEDLVVPCSQLPEGTEKKGRKRRRRRREEAGLRKRKLSEEQASFLEMRFCEEKKLESGRKAQLAMEAGLDPKQVAVWFQNRRTRWKNKQLEEEYSRLKSAHDAAIVANCHLEAEILKLKEQLTVAHTEIARLSCEGGGGGGGGGEVSSSSPSTSLSVEVHQPLLEDNMLYGNLGNMWDNNPWTLFGLDDLYSTSYIF